ncbi:MAG: hypothetical protein HY300_11480 [Verrucomicrobia bacterium]|nr:hypothetical protein [Verrucomicrobiota bacterium]
MFVESFLVKIATAVFKKAAMGAALAKAASVYEIYSTIDSITDFAHCVHSTNDCNELAVCGLQVISDPLVDHTIQELVGAGSHSFVVEETTSGIYIVSRLAPTFAVPQLKTEFEQLKSLAIERLENSSLITRRLKTNMRRQNSLSILKLENQSLGNWR